jgi:hypothetical protein
MRQLAASVVLVGFLLGPGVPRTGAAGRQDLDRLIVTGGPTGPAERTALVEALRLLPRLPTRVAVIDAEDARPEVKVTLLKLDAFTIKGSSVVYIVRQSALFGGAVERQAFHTYALASVIWHEIAHAEGADEREARQREQQLWTTFVRDQRIDQVTALRYLNALAMRPDAQMVTAR